MTRSRAGDRGALRSLHRGLRVATGRPALVTAVWGWHLVLGFALTLPMFRWLYAATAHRPESDVLAERFSLGVFVDLLQFDTAPVLRMLQAALTGGLIVAVLASPLVIAATLTSVRDASRDRRELGAAIAALYWPFLLVIIVGRAVALSAAGITAALAGVALAPLSGSTWEPGFLWAAAIQAVMAVLVAVLLLAAVDYALVRLEAGRSPGALSAWLAGVREAVARAGLTLGVWAGAGVVLAVLVAVYIFLREGISFAAAGDAKGGTAGEAVGGPSALALGAAFFLQQAFMFTRTWLRVGLLAAEQDASDREHDASRAIHSDSGAGWVEEPGSASPPAGETGPAIDTQPR